jgi:zinc transporter, ZIP family
MLLEVGRVAAIGLATALATGLGPLPLLLVGRMGMRLKRAANLFAAVLMAVASGLLILDGARLDPVSTFVGVAVGAAALAATRPLVRGGPELHLGRLSGLDARKVLLFVGVMTLHSFAEGVGVGVAFGSGAEFGGLMALLIALQNLPEGLAIGLVLVPRGVSVRVAAGWSVVSSLPQPLMAVPAFLSVSLFALLLPAGLGFAAGAMIWMILVDMLPDIRATR